MRTLRITDSKTIATAQKEFNEMFPFLKLEFFLSPNKIFKSAQKRQTLNQDTLLKQCRTRHTKGALLIKENMTVHDLEKLFKSVFGLWVQVFRKSGRSWIETTVTHDWTLKQQNDEGAELSALVK